MLVGENVRFGGDGKWCPCINGRCDSCVIINSRFR